MSRIVALTLTLLVAGCVSTPNTKALITPIGGIGIHAFAPPSPDRMAASKSEQVARIERDHRRIDAVTSDKAAL